MAKKPIYKHVITVEVLTDEPTDLSAMTLSGIAEEITDGGWSGIMTVDQGNIKLVGKKAVEAVKAQGSDPEFFRLDNKGNELD
jgi:hypothetical protein